MKAAVGAARDEGGLGGYMEVVRTRVKGVYRKLVLEVRALGVRVWYD